MAPSVRAGRVSKAPATGLRSYAKITKPSVSRIELDQVIKQAKIEPVVHERKTASKSNPKRKRRHDCDDSENDSATIPTTNAAAKKPKLQLPSPPSSQPGVEDTVEVDLPAVRLGELSLRNEALAQSTSAVVEELSTILQEFVSLHAAFLKAFALHIVHNGKSAPADLNSLMGSTSRLWKKRNVTKDDLQRMLAIYELGFPDDHAPGQCLKHKEGPFKLSMTQGDVVRYSVEYVGDARAAHSQYDELRLQKLYELEVEATCIAQRKKPDTWLHKDIKLFPRLDFSVGLQSQARKNRATAIRKEILGLSTQAQNRPGAQFGANQSSPYSEVDEIKTPQVVKDRTLSLLDRVRAKALANSAVAPQSADAVTRRYAIGRIGEVVEILRMKQQRKLASNFDSSVHTSPGKVRGKVSFSLNQLVGDIKGSLAVPMGEAEIRKCIEMLANDIPGIWLSIFALGSVQSVVLNGPGLSGTEVKKILDQQTR